LDIAVQLILLFRSLFEQRLRLPVLNGSFFCLSVIPLFFLGARSWPDKSGASFPHLFLFPFFLPFRPPPFYRPFLATLRKPVAGDRILFFFNALGPPCCANCYGAAFNFSCFKFLQQDSSCPAYRGVSNNFNFDFLPPFPPLLVQVLVEVPLPASRFSFYEVQHFTSFLVLSLLASFLAGHF